MNAPHSRGRKAAAARVAPDVQAIESYELEPPLPAIESDPTRDTLGIASALSGKAHHGLKISRSFMSETYGGGSLEAVPEFDVSRAITSGLTHPGDLVWPQLRPRTPTFPDLGAADGLQAESVFLDPKDTRRPVPNSAVVPWRCIAMLNIEFVDGTPGRGTGWFISPQTLVTAAHCVHDPIHGRARSMVATPGFHAGAAPYGHFTVNKMDVHPGWFNGFPRALDFALIFVSRPAGVGFFGYAAADDAGLSRVLVNIAGYPRDHLGTQWFDGGRILRADDNFIYHTIDTEAGQSGSPVFWSDRQQRLGLGIHTYGASSMDRTNVARRITKPLFDMFEARKI